MARYGFPDMTNIRIRASDTLQASANTAHSMSSGVPTVHKAIKVPYAGSVRVKWSITALSGSAYSYLYINGISTGISLNANSVTIEQTADIPVQEGDVVQIYATTPTGGTVNYMRVYYDYGQPGLFSPIVSID